MTHRSDAELDTAREPASSGTGVPQAGNQEARRADLRRWKAIALSLLLLAAVIFWGARGGKRRKAARRCGSATCVRQQKLAWSVAWRTGLR